MNRRQFLKTVSAGVLGATCVPGSLNARESSSKPNIILVMADDISAREFPTYDIPNPTYGDGPCVTPVFERMKNRGVQFAHSWATPLCHPSRGVMTLLPVKAAEVKSEKGSMRLVPLKAGKWPALFEDVLGPIVKTHGP